MGCIACSPPRVARGAESWLLFAPWFVVPFAGEGELGGKPEDYNRTIGGFAMRFVTAIAVCLAPISSAFGQIDATTLRAKYGDPIIYGKRVNSETFKVRNNITMMVNYGPSGQACRIEVHPAGQSTVRQAPPDIVTKQQVDEVLQEVVPPYRRASGSRSKRKLA